MLVGFRMIVSRCLSMRLEQSIHGSRSLIPMRRVLIRMPCILLAWIRFERNLLRIFHFTIRWRWNCLFPLAWFRWHLVSSCHSLLRLIIKIILASSLNLSHKWSSCLASLDTWSFSNNASTTPLHWMQAAWLPIWFKPWWICFWIMAMLMLRKSCIRIRRLFNLLWSYWHCCLFQWCCLWSR